MTGRVSYNEGLGLFLGLDDDGSPMAVHPDDMPAAVKAGKVRVHGTEEEDDSPKYEGSHVEEDLADPTRNTARVDAYETRVSPQSEEEHERSAGNPTGMPVQHIEPEPDEPQMQAGEIHGGGGAPGMMAAAGSALGQTALGASPGIPGVRPNSGKPTKPAPGAGDLTGALQTLQAYRPGEGYDQWSDDAALRQAQKTTAQNQLAAGLERAGTTINAAMTRRNPDYSSSNDLERMSGQPVADVEARRAAADQDLKRASTIQGMQGAQYQRQMQLEMMDASSDRSARARSVLQQANPDFVKRFSPEEYAKLSANDIGGLGELGKTVLTHTMELEKADKEKQAGIEAAAARQKSAQEQQDAERKAKEAFDASEHGKQRAFESGEHEKNRQNARDLASSGLKAQRLTDTQAAQMRDDLDPNKGRGSNLALNQRRLDQADRLKALITDSGGNIRNLDRRQVEELAIGLDSMLSGGGHGAESQVKALVPNTVMGNASKLAEWLTNEPTGTNQVEFVKRMAETVDRERAVSAGQIKKAQIQRLPVHSALKERDPDTYNAILQGYGIDPNEAESGKPSPTPTGRTKTVKGKVWEELSDGTARPAGGP